MVRLSRYTHTFELDDAVALYHSLRMKPVYLNRKSYEDLQAWLAGPSCVVRPAAHVSNRCKSGVRPVVGRT